MINWKENYLLKNFSEKELQALTPYLEVHQYDEGQLIIEEGRVGDKLYMIENGTVEIFKENITLTHLISGQYFGVMALLDESKRSASVKATTKTQLKSIDLSTLKMLSNHAEDSVFFKILLNHLHAQQRTLRTMNIATIHETKQKWEEAKKRVSFSNFFLFTLGLLIFYMFVLGILLEWKEQLHQSLYLSLVVPFIIGGLGAACFRFVRNSDSPLSFFGLTTENWRSHLIESIYWTIPFLLLITAGKYFLTLYFEPFVGRAIFEPENVFRYNLLGVLLMYSVYTLFCPIQEFIVRGVYQTGLEELYTGKNKMLKAIILSNLLFASFHLFFNLYFALMTLIPGIFWGFMYERQRTLVGVGFSHIVIGVYASFLGFF